MLSMWAVAQLMSWLEGIMNHAAQLEPRLANHAQKAMLRRAIGSA